MELLSALFIFVRLLRRSRFAFTWVFRIHKKRNNDCDDKCDVIIVFSVVCTPVGFVRLFGVVGSFLVKPQFLKNLDEEFFAYRMEEDCISRRFVQIRQKDIKAEFKIDILLLYEAVSLKLNELKVSFNFIDSSMQSLLENRTFLRCPCRLRLAMRCLMLKRNFWVRILAWCAWETALYSVALPKD